MTQVLYVHGEQFADVMAIAYQIPAICAGRVPQYENYAASFAATLGNAFLANVKMNFVNQSRSERGFDNTIWTPNRPRTAIRKVEKFKGALKKNTRRSKAFNKRYQEYLALVKQTKANLRPTFVTSKDPVIKKQQIKALDDAVHAAIGDFAHVVRLEDDFRDVQRFQLTAILRDTDRMFNSLSAGIEDQPYNGKDADMQIFIPQPGMIIVGTNVEYAATHQHGDASRGIPARPFFPQENQIPQYWLDDMYDAARHSIAIFIRSVWGLSV